MTDSDAVKSVLKRYLDKLRRAISRSPLLDATPSALGRGSKLDLTHLNRFGQRTAETLVDKVLRGRSYRIYPRLRNYAPDDDVEVVQDDQVRIFRQMERHLIRTADKIERETGNRSLWLAYPLLYLSDPSDRNRAILAPIFLWPIRARIDSSRPMCVEIEFDKKADAPSLNGIMRAWIKTKLGLELPSEEPASTREELNQTLAALFTELSGLDIEDVTGELLATPRRREIPPQRSPAVLNAGVIGIMRWHNQSLMDDIEDLLSLDEFEGPITTFATGRTVVRDDKEGYSTESDRHHVTGADYSQERVIVQARTGPGVIVHGPPGTGKSQTITNMIADTLARQESVLVVCQKRAAVDVVANNLTEAGLRDLFVAVHDVVSDREPVIDLLREQLDRLRALGKLGEVLPDLDIGRRGGHDPAQRRANLCQQIEELESKLDNAHRELHEPRRCGLSFSKIMVRLIQIEQAHPEARQDQSVIGQLLLSSTQEDLNRCLKLIEDLGRLYESCEPDDHPWRARQPGFDLTPDTRRTFEKAMQRCFEAVDAHDAFCAEHGIGLPLDRDPAEYRRHARAVLERLQSLTDDADFPAIVLLYRRLQEDATAREAYREVRQLAERIGDAPLDERIDQLFPRLDSQERSRTIELIEATLPYRRWWLTWLRVLSSQYRTLRRQLRPKLLASGLAWSAGELRSLQATLQGRADRERLDALLGQLDMLDPASRGSDSERVQAAQALERRLRLCVNLSESKADFSQVAEVLRVMRRGEPDAVKAWQNQLHVALERCELVQRCHVSLDGLCDLLLPPFVKNLKQEMNRGRSVRDELGRLQSTFATIPQLLAYQRYYDRLDDSDRELIDHLIARHRNELGERHSLAHHWRVVTEVSVFNKWRRQAIEEAPVLETIDEEMLGTLREDLRQALQSKMKVEAEAIHQHWTAKGREAVDERWKRYLRKRGRGAKRLREVVHRGDSLGLLKLRPCWLTNPETASQIFPLDEGLFDLVIFDEASQLPLEQAMPAIYRGHRVVVAGDEHQLPPTSFFQTSSSGADDDILDDLDEDDADAVTSGGIARREGIELAIHCTDLLDLSKDILPERLLNVHYRSRHPALIEFSNWAYYKGRLEAAHPTWGMPTPDAAPIRFHRVNGIYERRTNRAEARHVLNLLLYLWSQPGKVPTIGVVTFNKEQEELIEEEIARRASTDHNFRSLLEREKERKSGEKEVGFFVKNLESVQGDERDLIIFSTTFAPIEPGNPASMRRYFGPLTHSGGERRLNVAVTRARDGIIVVTSMPLERISDIHTGIEPGQKIKARDYLQAYMMYADAVSNADGDRTQRWLNCAARLSSHERDIGNRSAIREFDSEFEEQVYDRLVDAGWAVDTQVGQNNFKIDLAVRHPDPAKGYLLGIECDGATYHGNLTARARDIWREDILKEYGWRIYRIWSTRWWTFQDDVMEELLGLLNELIEAEPVTGSVLRQPLPELDGLPSEPVAVPAKPLAPTGRPLPTPAMEPSLEELQFDGRPDAWASQFECLVLERSPDDGEVASWHDPSNHLFEILLEHHRGSPMVFLRREGEEFGHFSVREADPTVLRNALDRLKGVKDHGDILDWFHWIHRELYPGVWADK